MQQHKTSRDGAIKVLVPDMPRPAEIMESLSSMEKSGVYVNNGPLSRKLASAISEGYGMPCAVVSNGTLALELALRALGLPPGSTVMVPSLTFVGSAQAIVNAGLRPLIVDVDPHSLQMSLPKGDSRCPDVVMPVAVYGRPVVNLLAWATLCRYVVVDAAAALLSQDVPPLPNLLACFSMHATKFIGAGEGGVVVSSNRRWVDDVASLANFGPGGTNAKMSEYHAAVGVASLQPGRLSARCKLAASLYSAYMRNLLDINAVRLPPSLITPTLFPVIFPTAESAMAVESALSAANIESKRWYAPFLHCRPQFSRYCPHDEDYFVSGRIESCCLGLPFHSFMSVADVERVCAVVKAAL